VTVSDKLPAGLTATAMAGTGWTCSLGTLRCTRGDALGAGSSYPPITLMVKVAWNAPSIGYNTATVSGGGESNTSNDTAKDATPIPLVVGSGGTINLATGLNCYNQLITSNGTSDCHWAVKGNPAQAVEAGSADWNSGWLSDGANSDWIAINANQTSNGPAPYSFKLSFDLSGSDLSSVSLSGLWTIDDTGTLSLNGNQIASLDASTSPWRSLHSFLVPAGSPFFKQGLNTLTITMTWNDNNHEGVRLEGTVRSYATPQPDLTISKTHTGEFTQGQVGATYTLGVSNVGTLPSSGTVTVTDNLPTRLGTATAMAGAGWTCSLGTLSCTRGDALGAGSSYPPITLTIKVGANAPTIVTNTATVSGGGESYKGNDTAGDRTMIALVVGSGGTINLATGLNCFNQLITTNGTSDCHWTVKGNRAQVVEPGGADWYSGWLSNGPHSNWIAINANQTSNGPPPYGFTLTFDLSGSNLSTVSLSGLWTIDYAGTLKLNGNWIAELYARTSPWTSLHSFSVPAGSPFFKQGLNILTITMTRNDNVNDGVRLEGVLMTTR
jgi:uncharacterized repeat protein (TIGR01451 family)